MAKTHLKKLKVLTIDVDGCLISYENVGGRFHSSWEAIGFAYGLNEIWSKRLDTFYGNPEYDKMWAEEDAKDLSGKDVDTALKVLYPLPYCDGSQNFSIASKGKFIRGLLTSAIDLVAKQAQKELGLDFCFCNTLHRNNGHFSGSLDYLVPLWEKDRLLPQICREYNVNLEEICHIGDNENDIPVAEKVGLFIAVNPKTRKVETLANYIAEDFNQVSSFLGLK